MGLKARRALPILPGILQIRTATVSKQFGNDLFDAVGLTDSANIWTQPAGSVLLGVKMVLDAQFVATGLTDLDVSLGDAGDNDGLLVQAMNLVTGAVGSKYSTRGAYWDTSAKGALWFQLAARTWIAYATAVGANLSTLTAGKVTFYFTYLEIG